MKFCNKSTFTIYLNVIYFIKIQMTRIPEKLDVWHKVKTSKWKWKIITIQWEIADILVWDKVIQSSISELIHIKANDEARLDESKDSPTKSFDEQDDELFKVLKKIEDDVQFEEEFVNELEKGWFKVIPTEQFIAWLKEFEKWKEFKIYWDDLEWLEQLTKKSDLYHLEMAENQLQQNNISSSIEEMIYDFYKVYRNKDNTLELEQDVKLRIKWQLKHWTEHLLFCIRGNYSNEMNNALSSLKFILSERYLQQIKFKDKLGKDVREQLLEWNNISLFLKSHIHYKSIYENLMDSLSWEERLKNIIKVLDWLAVNWSTYSEKEQKEINHNFGIVWDMWLNYTLDKDLYTSLESLILRFQKIEKITSRANSY